MFFLRLCLRIFEPYYMTLRPEFVGGSTGRKYSNSIWFKFSFVFFSILLQTSLVSTLAWQNPVLKPTLLPEVLHAFIVYSVLLYVPSISYSLLSRLTNTQNIFINNILNIVSTRICFIASASSSGSLNLVLCTQETPTQDCPDCTGVDKVSLKSFVCKKTCRLWLLQ